MHNRYQHFSLECCSMHIISIAVYDFFLLRCNFLKYWHPFKGNEGGKWQLFIYIVFFFLIWKESNGSLLTAEVLQWTDSIASSHCMLHAESHVLGCQNICMLAITWDTQSIDVTPTCNNIEAAAIWDVEIFTHSDVDRVAGWDVEAWAHWNATDRYHHTYTWKALEFS